MTAPLVASWELALTLTSPLNAAKASSRRASARTRQQQRGLVAIVAGQGLRAAAAAAAPGQEWTVRLTRIAPRAFDDDNLAASFKAIRDQIAADLGRDDGPSSGIVWVYEQRRGRPREHAVTIDLHLGLGACPTCGTPGAYLELEPSI